VNRTVKFLGFEPAADGTEFYGIDPDVLTDDLAEVALRILPGSVFAPGWARHEHARRYTH
jgi:hypothetical protein